MSSAKPARSVPSAHRPLPIWQPCAPHPSNPFGHGKAPLPPLRQGRCGRLECCGRRRSASVWRVPGRLRATKTAARRRFRTAPTPCLRTGAGG
jgi:hypothetical protein